MQDIFQIAGQFSEFLSLNCAGFQFERSILSDKPIEYSVYQCLIFKLGNCLSIMYTICMQEIFPKCRTVFRISVIELCQGHPACSVGTFVDWPLQTTECHGRAF
jgi:hypothetical protein